MRRESGSDFVIAVEGVWLSATISVDSADGFPVVEQLGDFRTGLFGGNLFCFSHDSEDVAAHDLVDLGSRVASIEQFLGDQWIG